MTSDKPKITIEGYEECSYKEYKNMSNEDSACIEMGSLEFRYFKRKEEFPIKFLHKERNFCEVNETGKLWIEPWFSEDWLSKTELFLLKQAVDKALEIQERNKND